MLGHCTVVSGVINGVADYAHPMNNFDMLREGSVVSQCKMLYDHDHNAAQDESLVCGMCVKSQR